MTARSRIGLFLVVSLLALPTLGPAQNKTFTLTADEKRILELTNKARKEEGASPLVANPALTRCAREHSANMAKQKTMAHDLDGKTPFDRIKAIGYVYRRAGENVAYGDGPVPIDDIFDGWMKSEGHRKNILNPDFTEIGIGVGTIEQKKYYTQVFGRPLKQ